MGLCSQSVPEHPSVWQSKRGLESAGTITGREFVTNPSSTREVSNERGGEENMQNDSLPVIRFADFSDRLGAFQRHLNEHKEGVRVKESKQLKSAFESY